MAGTGEITDLQEAFKLLDKDQKGYIDPQVLMHICRKLGEDLTEEEVRLTPPRLGDCERRADGGVAASLAFALACRLCVWLGRPNGAHARKRGFSEHSTARLVIHHYPIRPAGESHGRRGAHWLRGSDLLRRPPQNPHHAVRLRSASSAQPVGAGKT